MLEVEVRKLVANVRDRVFVVATSVSIQGSVVEVLQGHQRCLAVQSVATALPRAFPETTIVPAVHHSIRTTTACTIAALLCLPVIETRNVGVRVESRGQGAEETCLSSRGICPCAAGVVRGVAGCGEVITRLHNLNFLVGPIVLQGGQRGRQLTYVTMPHGIVRESDDIVVRKPSLLHPCIEVLGLRAVGGALAVQDNLDVASVRGSAHTLSSRLQNGCRATDLRTILAI